MQKHILAIDDEPEILALLQEALSGHGYRVSVAASAEAARRVVKSDPPQLVISDLQMEDTDGLVLATELRAALPDVPILLLTGMVFDHEVVRDIIQKKFTSYLDKTTPLDEIVTEVRRLLGDSRPPA
jgi:two-component system response regulator GlrR